MLFPKILSLALATLLATATAQDDNPVVGSKCNDNGDCSVNSSLYCSPEKGNTCQLRSGPSEKCEMNEACYEGECRGNVCGGKKAGADCARDIDCEVNLDCIPLPRNYFNGEYDWKCEKPREARNAGAWCQGDEECGFPFYCVIKGGTRTYCGINPGCVASREKCSEDKDCCRARCVKKSSSVSSWWECGYQGAVFQDEL